MFHEVDQIFWNWCANANNAKKSAINVDICDYANEYQVWNIYVADNTWRPDVDGVNYVEANPSKSGANGGGQLKIIHCTDKDKKIQAQVFLWCKEITKCKFDKDTVFLIDDCYREDECS